MHYDYLIAGAGLFGATVAHELTDAGKKKPHLRVHVFYYTKQEDILNILQRYWRV